MLQTISKLELIIDKQKLLSIHQYHTPYNEQTMLTMMSICTKMKTNRVRYQPLTTPQVVLIFIIALHLCDLNNNMKYNPLTSAEPCKELTKPKNNNKYFWCF